MWDRFWERNDKDHGMCFIYYIVGPHAGKLPYPAGSF